MPMSHSLLRIGLGLLIVADLSGCAYTREMEKAKAERAEIDSKLQWTRFATQVEEEKTASLVAERDRVRKALASQQQQLASLQGKLAQMSRPAPARRTARDQAELARVRAEIATTERQVAEKQARLDYLNEKL